MNRVGRTLHARWQLALKVLPAVALTSTLLIALIRLQGRLPAPDA
jgi:hypothetical protein